MRRVILIVPHLLSLPDGQSYVRGLHGVERLAQDSTLFRVGAMPAESTNLTKKGSRASLTPEAAWLGLDPTALHLQQGPLTISALGAEPPSDAVQFHLSVASFNGDVAHVPTLDIPAEELSSILKEAKRLNTSKLTLVPGEGKDHGLVWENGSLEMGVSPVSALDDQPLNPHLPEGDGENLLRRYIDDSVNLLTELEFNQRRIDEGLPPFNLLWPWGPGYRESVPNLALRRGAPAYVQSSSLRLAGLTKLARYIHGSRSEFGRGLNTKLMRLAELKDSPLIVFIDTFTQLRLRDKPEEMDWFARELDRELIQPLIESSLETGKRITLLAPGGYTSEGNPTDASAEGLAMIYDSTDKAAGNDTPLDERALEDKRLSKRTAWEIVAEGIA